MIQHPSFPVEPWRLRETELHVDRLAQTESVFALANGHIGLRGNLDEGEPFGLPGNYLGGFYEVRPLTYPETGYGYPDTGRSVVNVTNGKLIRLLVEDEPFDVRYGELRRSDASRWRRCVDHAGAVRTAGIDLDALAASLQSDGAQKFVQAWTDLMNRIDDQVALVKA